MKSVIAVHTGHLEILDTPVPKPGPYQALVKTECACLCNRTDSELLHGNFPGMEDKFPFALGHESVGIVTEIGEKDRVDVVLTNPPFGGEEEAGIRGNFPADKQTSETINTL